MNTSIRNNSLTAVINNKVYSADSTHPNWSGIMDAVRANNDNALISAINVRQTVANFVSGKVRVVGNEVLFGDMQIGGVVVDRLLNFIAEKIPAEPIVKFIENLYSNPSQRAVTELYTFLEHKNLPITPNGNFLAYKGIQTNWYSITSGKLTLLQGTADSGGHIFNGVGETVECVRNQVDDNRDNTCSTGIHAGSMEYATSFGAGGRVVIVEINPKDVVSIPSDCNGQKLRTCKYKIVGEYQGALNSTYNSSYHVSADDVNEIGSDEDEVDERTYEDGYEDGFKQGKLDSDSGKTMSTFLSNTDYEDYDDGYKDGYEDGYEEPVIAEPVISNTVQNDYLSGYKDGRSDSNNHNGRTNHGGSNSYTSGYNDGYGHKAKQY